MSEAGDASPLSVLHLCAPAHVGGLERVVQGLSVGAAGHGHRVGVAAVIEPGADPSAFLDPIREASVRTWTLELPGRAYLGEWRGVRRLLAEVRPDVLHTHGYRSDLLHGGSARRVGIASVSTLHGSSRMGGVSHLFEWIQERALARFDGVVAVSAPLVDALVRRGVPRERIHEVPNAWTPPAHPMGRSEARRALGAAPDEVAVGWIGRLIPVKGCDVFLEALAQVEAGGWRVHIVGDGPERPALEARAEALGLADRVRFLGAIPDAARMFAGLDLFVLSSRSEGTPMVLLEAMGAGTAVVATAVGGVPDVVRDPVEGWVVPPEEPAALATALEQALGDETERERRAAASAARIAARFDFDAWIERHVEVYRAAMRVRRADAR